MTSCVNITQENGDFFQQNVDEWPGMASLNGCHAIYIAKSCLNSGNY